MMPNDLLDLSETVERMAVAMWKHEAIRAQRWSTADRRTLGAFRGESREIQNKWLGLASAALEAVLKREGQKDEVG